MAPKRQEQEQEQQNLPIRKVKNISTTRSKPGGFYKSSPTVTVTTPANSCDDNFIITTELVAAALGSNAKADESDYD
jgi:hypothetical protein